jgi:hypothetical protein
MDIRMDVDLPGLRRLFAGVERQVDFAVARALTATAKNVQRAIPAGLERALDKPTPFTKGAEEGPRASTFIRSARRNKLVAEVVFKGRQAEYLRWQVEGGERRPKRKALRLPADIALDAYGNIPRGTIAKLLAVAQREQRLAKRTSRTIRVSRDVEIFYGDPTDVGIPDSPPGIYKRVRLPDGRGRLIPLIVFPQTTATYRKRVDLQAIARPAVDRHFQSNLVNALRDALRTAR